MIPVPYSGSSSDPAISHKLLCVCMVLLVWWLKLRLWVPGRLYTARGAEIECARVERTRKIPRLIIAASGKYNVAASDSFAAPGTHRIGVHGVQPNEKTIACVAVLHAHPELQPYDTARVPGVSSRGDQPSRIQIWTVTAGVDLIGLGGHPSMIERRFCCCPAHTSCLKLGDARSEDRTATCVGSTVRFVDTNTLLGQSLHIATARSALTMKFIFPRFLPPKTTPSPDCSSTSPHLLVAGRHE